jgi:hypothetical protein
MQFVPFHVESAIVAHVFDGGIVHRFPSKNEPEGQKHPTVPE